MSRFRFNTVALPSADIERTMAFFQAIGFEPIRAIEVRGKIKKWNLLYLGANSEICYYPAESAGEIFSSLKPSSNNSAGMMCINCDKKNEVDRLYTKLSKAGYAQVAPSPTEWGRYAVYFRDPDGYCYEYSSPAPQKASSISSVEA